MADETGPRRYDISGGSSNTYLLEERHGLPRCLHCGRGSEILMEGGDYWRVWNQGENLLNVVRPNATRTRQLLVGVSEITISGIHPECWEAFLGPEPD